MGDTGPLILTDRLPHRFPAPQIVGYIESTRSANPASPGGLLIVIALLVLVIGGSFISGAVFGQFFSERRIGWAATVDGGPADLAALKDSVSQLRNAIERQEAAIDVLTRARGGSDGKLRKMAHEAEESLKQLQGYAEKVEKSVESIDYAKSSGK